MGKIKRITNIDNHKALYIHYDGWHKQYDEKVDFDSPRFAKLGYYTARSDIPKYHLEGSNNCVAYLIVPNLKSFFYKNFTYPHIDTADLYYKYENSKICD